MLSPILQHQLGIVLARTQNAECQGPWNQEGNGNETNRAALIYTGEKAESGHAVSAVWLESFLLFWAPHVHALPV